MFGWSVFEENRDNRLFDPFADAELITFQGVSAERGEYMEHARLPKQAQNGLRLIIFIENAGGTGFEPVTPSLGGSCPILARLPAHK